MILTKERRGLIRAGYSTAQKKTLYFTPAEILENFEEQEKTGEPLYSFYDYENGKKITPPGFLIWSLLGGCGVAYRRADGAVILVKGVQSDFCCC